MILKKTFWQIPFSKTKEYELCYENEIDLKDGIIKLCNLLKKDYFIIQFFSGEQFNKTMSSCCNDSKISVKNFNYYIVDELPKCFNQLELNSLRFLNIYSIEKKYWGCMNINCIIKNASFCLGLDNYLEYTKIVINLNSYMKDILKDF